MTAAAKPRPTLLPARALLDAALLMAEQEAEHGDRWLDRTAQHHVDAAGRHLLEHAAGELVDESGHSPLIHAALRCLMAWEREQAAAAGSPLLPPGFTRVDRLRMSGVSAQDAADRLARAAAPRPTASTDPGDDA